MEETMKCNGDCMSKASGMCTFNIAEADDIFDELKPMRYDQFEADVMKWQE